MGLMLGFFYDSVYKECTEECTLEDKQKSRFLKSFRFLNILFDIFSGTETVIVTESTQKLRTSTL